MTAAAPEYLVASREVNQCSESPESVELRSGEECYVPFLEPAERGGVVSDELGGGAQPLLLTVPQVECCGEGIDGILYHLIARGQRPSPERIVHEGRRRRRHAVGSDKLVRGVEHFRPVEEPLLQQRLDGVVILYIHRFPELPVAPGELFYVPHERAAEGHHVHLLALRTDDPDFLGHYNVPALPNWYARSFPRSHTIPCRDCIVLFSGPRFFARFTRPVCRSFRFRSLRLSPREGQRDGVVVLFLEVSRNTTEIEQEIKFLFVFRVLQAEGKQASPPTLDLDVLGRRENRAHEDHVQKIAAVVAGREHVHGNRDAFGALAVPKLFRQVGRFGDARCNRHRQAGLQSVQYLCQVRRVPLVHGEDNALPYLPSRVVLCVL